MFAEPLTQFQTQEYFFKHFIETVLAFFRCERSPKYYDTLKVPFKKPVKIATAEASGSNSFREQRLLPQNLKVAGITLKEDDDDSSLNLEIVTSEDGDKEEINEVRVGGFDYDGDEGIEVHWLDLRYLFDRETLKKLNNALRGR